MFKQDISSAPRIRYKTAAPALELALLYQVWDDDPSMLQITATVKERGVRQPGLVRPDPEGGYEIIAGERRHCASELAGLEDMPGWDSSQSVH